MLRHYCFGNVKTFVINAAKLGSIVLAVTAVSLGPFINHLPQLLSRLFPFKRGLTHAYWAPNFWALYNFMDKGLSIALKVPSKSSNTGGLVQEHVHTVLPSITPQMTFIITAVSMLPCCIKIVLHREESAKSFLKPLIICAACSFMFGWHVHEKAILMVLIPLQILSANSPSEMTSSFFLSVFGLYSLMPLLFSKELVLIKLSLYLAYVIFSYYCLKSLGTNKLRIYEKLYCYCIVLLPVYEFGIQYVFKLDQKLPFMSLMLTSVYCAIGMFYFWFKYYIEYLCEHMSQKKKKTK